MGKIVVTCGIFDLCHKGHLNLLRECRIRAGADGILVAVVHDDKSCFKIKDKIPIQDLDRRIWNLELTGIVDECVITKDVDPANEFLWLMGKYEDMIFVRGDDNKDFPGKWVLENYKVPIEYVKYTEGVSSSKLREELI